MKSRLIFSIAACLLLSNCGLIGTALRLAPYALLFADKDGKAATSGGGVEMRGREVQGKGGRRCLPMEKSTESQVAFKP